MLERSDERRGDPSGVNVHYLHFHLHLHFLFVISSAVGVLGCCVVVLFVCHSCPLRPKQSVMRKKEKR